MAGPTQTEELLAELVASSHRIEALLVALAGTSNMSPGMARRYGTGEAVSLALEGASPEAVARHIQERRGGQV